MSTFVHGVASGGGAPPLPGAARLTVAVPTYRRPRDLAAALPLLVAHAREVSDRSDGRYLADVLVVDNDPEGSAEAVVRALDDPLLRYVVEPTPGIGAVRNRAIDEAADARLLAFIDDDERPLPNWLAALVDTWYSTGAAAVSGRVISEFSGELDPWIRAGDFFFRRRRPTGSPIGVAAAGNLLLDLAQVRGHGIRFDPVLGLAGGEDTLFSRSLTAAGGRIVWCDESAAIDAVPPERMTREWVLTRAWGHGNVAVRTDLRLTPSAARRLLLRLRWTGQGLLRMTGGTGRWCWGIVGRSTRHQARGLRTAWRGAGMVGACVGLVYEEYARGGRRLRFSRGAGR